MFSSKENSTMNYIKKAFHFITSKWGLMLEELKPQSHWILRTCLTSIFIYLGRLGFRLQF